MSKYEFVKIDVPPEYAPLARMFADKFMQMQHRGGAPAEVAAFVAMGMLVARGRELPALASKPFAEVADVAFRIVDTIMNAEGVTVGDDEDDSEPTEAEKAAEEMEADKRFAALKARGVC